MTNCYAISPLLMCKISILFGCFCFANVYWYGKWYFYFELFQRERWLSKLQCNFERLCVGVGGVLNCFPGVYIT